MSETNRPPEQPVYATFAVHGTTYSITAHKLGYVIQARYPNAADKLVTVSTFAGYEAAVQAFAYMVQHELTYRHHNPAYLPR